jgi:hypothetical protein
MTRVFALLAAVAVVCLLVPVRAAEDFTGKWTGSFLAGRPDGSTSNDTIFMDLKHKGAELTGTVGPREDRQYPVIEGKVAGDKVSFQVNVDGALVTFALAFAEGHLKGDAAAALPDGQKLAAKIDAERQK